MLEKLIDIHSKYVTKVSQLSMKRYLFSRINWNNQLIGILGPRGVGKTTLMLHYYIDTFSSPKEALYVSADHIIVEETGLYTIAEEFFKYGGKTLLIDEIHKYKNWKQELKNIYDSFPDKKIIFSGSSSLTIREGSADLSRRVVTYSLEGLSLREFIWLKENIHFQPFSLEDIIKDHVSLIYPITSKLSILKYFKEYLQYGYYPFFTEGIDSFYFRLANVCEKIFYEDIASDEHTQASTVHALKRLVYLVATSEPFTPNISKISSQLGISKEYTYIYIEALEKAHVFSLLYPQEQGFKLARKPQKIFLDNTNLFYLVREERGFNLSDGALRETFFMNQMKVISKLFYSAQVDFEDNHGHYFEIGGTSKESSNYPSNTLLVIDSIESGFGNKIPLWLFGFLY